MDNAGSISSQSDWVKVYFESQTDNLLINQVWGMRERWESRITPKAFDLCYGHGIRPFNTGRQRERSRVVSGHVHFMMLSWMSRRLIDIKSRG